MQNARVRHLLSTADLAGVARAALGPAVRLRSVDRLPGGTKKGVYRMTSDDGRTRIAYVWTMDEDYWPEQGERDAADPFEHASGIDLFETASRTLTGSGVRVPEIFWLDRSRTLLDADVAVLEDIGGIDLEALIGTDPDRGDPILAELGDAVRTMHSHRRDRYGRPETGRHREQHLRQPRHRLRYRSSDRVPELAAAQSHLAGTLRARYADVRPRNDYGLIHGELGPDHVRVDAQNRPVLIDVESYHHLADDDLDLDRLRLYRLAQYISLVAGPMRLLDGDFPDRDLMMSIINDNIARTLAELPG